MLTPEKLAEGHCRPRDHLSEVIFSDAEPSKLLA